MTAHKLTLLPDWREKKKATQRSYPLHFRWRDKSDPSGFHRLRVGDTVPIEIELSAGHKEIDRLFLHSFHLVSWPSSIAPAHQFFSTLFREDRDNPEGDILLQGYVKFEEQKRAAKKVRRAADPATARRYFAMTFPEPLQIARPGVFAFLVSLTIGQEPKGSGGTVPVLPLVKSFILDPEVEVDPTGSGPLPTGRRIRRGP